VTLGVTPAQAFNRPRASIVIRLFRTGPAEDQSKHDADYKNSLSSDKLAFVSLTEKPD
jgi:hypothetical protein